MKNSAYPLPFHPIHASGDAKRDNDFIRSTPQHICLHDAPQEVSYDTLPLAVGRVINFGQAFPFPWPQVTMLAGQHGPRIKVPVAPFIHTLVFRRFDGVIFEANTMKWADENDLYQFNWPTPVQLEDTRVHIHGTRRAYLDSDIYTYGIDVELEGYIDFQQDEMLLQTSHAKVAHVHITEGLKLQSLKQHAHMFEFIGFVLGSKEPVNYRPYSQREEN